MSGTCNGNTGTVPQSLGLADNEQGLGDDYVSCNAWASTNSPSETTVVESDQKVRGNLYKNTH